ncbi:MAG: imidazolonepropionase-like amidohydrolase, partial [Halioglobus sp.]
ADLLILTADPLEDITAMNRPLLVIKGGALSSINGK